MQRKSLTIYFQTVRLHFYAKAPIGTRPIKDMETFILLSNELESRGLVIRKESFESNGNSKGYSLEESKLANKLLVYISDYQINTDSINK